MQRLGMRTSALCVCVCVCVHVCVCARACVCVCVDLEVYAEAGDAHECLLYVHKPPFKPGFRDRV
jgi:hypothetical protein